MTTGRTDQAAQAHSTPAAPQHQVMVDNASAAPQPAPRPKAVSASLPIQMPSLRYTLGDFQRDIAKMLDGFKYDEKRGADLERYGLLRTTDTLINDLTNPAYVEWIGYYKDADRNKMRIPFAKAQFSYSRWQEVFESATKGLWDSLKISDRARVKEFCPELTIQWLYFFLGKDERSILKKDAYDEIPPKVALAMMFRYAREAAPLLVQKPKPAIVRSAPAILPTQLQQGAQAGESKQTLPASTASKPQEALPNAGPSQGVTKVLQVLDALYNPSHFKPPAASTHVRADNATVSDKAKQAQSAAGGVAAITVVPGYF